MKYFDSHAHYYDERFDEEGDVCAEELLRELFRDNLGAVVNIATSPENAVAAIDQAKLFENMYTAIGVHPSDTRFITDHVSALAEIEKLATDPESKCVAIGEIGLDYHYDGTDRELQLFYFREQMKMAQRVGLPVVIHDREAHADVLDVIKEFPNVRGVLHSFSGSAEMARDVVALGYMISFSGTLTFTNAKKPKEAAAAVPIEKIMIETDCPYLAPHPKRGTLNHSGNLVYTNAALAAIKGISEEECAAITFENANKFFSLQVNYDKKN